MNQEINSVTAKKYFRHIVDKNQSFLSAAVKQKRLLEQANRISNKMELIELEIKELSNMIQDYKTLERDVQSTKEKPIVAQESSLATLAKQQLNEEILKLEKMYTILSGKPSVDPHQLSTIAQRILVAKNRAQTKEIEDHSTKIELIE